MSEEGYNGWTNRATWACNLWITNDQGMYESAKERVELMKTDWKPVYNFQTEADWVHDAAASLQEWWEELTDPDEELMECKTILQMVRDIGDERVIDWAEIAESLVSE